MHWSWCPPCIWLATRKEMLKPWVPVLTIDSVGTLFKIQIFKNQGYSIISSLPSFPHNLASGPSLEHCAQTDTHTPMHSQPGPASIDLKVLVHSQKQLLHSQRPGHLHTAPTLLGCVLWYLQHLPSASPWDGSNDKFIGPSANARAPEEHHWGLSITAWRVVKGEERSLLMRMKNKPKPANLTRQNKNNPNKYLVVRKAF